LKSLWEKFDLSLLFLQTGIVKHSGISGWLMVFAYICALIAQKLKVKPECKFCLGFSHSEGFTERGIHQPVRFQPVFLETL